MYILINLTNHPSASWSESQKKDWDEIIDISFPNIPAEYSEKQINDLVSEYNNKLEKIAGEIEQNSELNLLLQGEFSFCYTLFKTLREDSKREWNFYIPTTERKVVEKINPDGTTMKISEFQFVRWRKIL